MGFELSASKFGLLGFECLGLGVSGLVHLGSTAGPLLGCSFHRRSMKRNGYKDLHENARRAVTRFTMFMARATTRKGEHGQVTQGTRSRQQQLHQQAGGSTNNTKEQR